MRARRVGIGSEWWDRHQTLDGQPRQPEKSFHLLAQLFRGEPNLTPLARHVYLQQNARMQSFVFRDAVHVARELDRIDAVKKFEERKCMTDFIPLQAPDEMPAGSRWQQWNLDSRFLDAALAKQLLPGLKRGPNLLGFVSLRNGDQLNIVHGTSAPFGGVFDLDPNPRQILSDVLHGEIVRQRPRLPMRFIRWQSA